MRDSNNLQERHCVSEGKTCLSEQLTRASQLHTRSGFTTYSPTEKPTYRSTDAEVTALTTQFGMIELNDPGAW